MDAVYLMWPFFDNAEDARRKIAPIAEQFGASVRRVVYLSSQTVENDPHSFWGVIEDALTEHAPATTARIAPSPSRSARFERPGD
ncbi:MULTISPECIES: hypothetical protein [unclassified Gordonia (in: high G+C Gram-positive bacteria)]|uniref:hypothetical protein n=1 Tax=unclassified Gordonia (in: high G+C Gram-positive bacteria) TaxID=2657482 RepID=UPI0007E9F6D6|nr:MULTISPECIES: hypothetical protein [unclassified Gordonia (in: high G+C Gram-positive bacteria)]OBC02684.1 hypothetical protein A5785_02410 [Gordonia sp. 852002-50395_SCH5434458]OBC10616.1 hypothetical protein A5786_04780 [Gordonia sp. 852002-50816_SCH5313054-a]OBC17349.1 hypothetical protein A5788_12645 [Gordonia sp. 852002-50816_SCH5313054-c]